MTARVLLVEDNPADALIITKMLRVPPAHYDVTHATSLSAALMALDAHHTEFVAVLLDLNLEDSQGIDTLTRITDYTPVTPVVILTGVSDMELSQNAVRRGAQDYLVKGEITGGMLDRTIRLAWERKRKDQVRKELEFESRAALTGLADDATVGMLRGHIKALNRFFEDLSLYLMKNDPQHADAINILKDNHHIELILRDMNGVLSLPNLRSRRISDHALEAVKTLSSNSVLPKSAEEAREALRDVLRGRG